MSMLDALKFDRIRKELRGIVADAGAWSRPSPRWSISLVMRDRARPRLGGLSHPGADRGHALGHRVGARRRGLRACSLPPSSSSRRSTASASRDPQEVINLAAVHLRRGGGQPARHPAASGNWSSRASARSTCATSTPSRAGWRWPSTSPTFTPRSRTISPPSCSARSCCSPARAKRRQQRPARRRHGAGAGAAPRSPTSPPAAAIRQRRDGRRRQRRNLAGARGVAEERRVRRHRHQSRPRVAGELRRIAQPRRRRAGRRHRHARAARRRARHQRGAHALADRAAARGADRLGQPRIAHAARLDPRRRHGAERGAGARQAKRSCRRWCTTCATRPSGSTTTSRTCSTPPASAATASSRTSNGPSPPTSSIRRSSAAAAASADRRVVLDLPNDLPLIHVDPVLVQQALVQIFDNAVKYSPPARRSRSPRARATAA